MVNIAKFIPFLKGDDINRFKKLLLLCQNGMDRVDYSKLMRIAVANKAIRIFTFLFTALNPCAQQVNRLAFLSAERGSFNCLKYLLENGKADPNCMFVPGTPLHVCRDRRCAALLLEHNGKPEARNREGNTPLDIAIRFKNIQIQKLLLQRTSPDAANIPFFLSCINNLHTGKLLKMGLVLNSGCIYWNQVKFNILTNNRGWRPLEREHWNERANLVAKRLIAMLEFYLGPGPPLIVMQYLSSRDLFSFSSFVEPSSFRRPGC